MGSWRHCSVRARATKALTRQSAMNPAASPSWRDHHASWNPVLAVKTTLHALADSGSIFQSPRNRRNGQLSIRTCIARGHCLSTSKIITALSLE
jgi:hypothetical protein